MDMAIVEHWWIWPWWNTGGYGHDGTLMDMAVLEHWWIWPWWNTDEYGHDGTRVDMAVIEHLHGLFVVPQLQ